MSRHLPARGGRRLWVGRSVLILMLVVFGWFKAGPALLNLRDAWSVADWSTTGGVVTVSESRTARNRRGGSQRSYHFEYEYTVDGGRWTGTRYSLADASGAAAAGCERHRRGEPIEVRYDPHHPDRAVVNPTASLFWNYVTVATLTFFLFALTTMAWAKFQKRRRTQHG